MKIQLWQVTLLLGALLLMTATVCVPALAQGAPPPPDSGNGGRGKITAISASSITVTDRDGNAKTFSITATTTVTLDGQPSTAASLATDNFAQVDSTDGTTATSINAHSKPPQGGPNGKGARGKITAVSASSITVTGPDGTAKTFSITSKTNVTLDGQASTAASLTTDYFAQINSTDGSTANGIDARSKPPQGGPNGKGARGQITAVSETAITITGREGNSKTFTVTPTTPVKLDGQTSTIASLTTSYVAQVDSTDGTNAAGITAYSKPPGGGPPALGKGGRGKITAVSASSITVTDRAGTAKTFSITSTTVVKLDGQDSTAGSLTTDYFAQVMSTDGTTATGIDAHSKPAPGGPGGGPGGGGGPQGGRGGPKGGD